MLPSEMVFLRPTSGAGRAARGRTGSRLGFFSVGTTEVEPSATRHFPSELKVEDLPLDSGGLNRVIKLGQPLPCSENYLNG